MREPIRDPQRLRHILEAIENILQFSNGAEEEDIHKNKILYYALVKNIEIIGEAAYMLTQSFKDCHPNTDWRVIIAMRHTLVHGYYQISPTEVWNVIRYDLNPLQRQIQSYLEEYR